MKSKAENRAKKRKAVKVRIVKRLDKYNNIILFPKKVEEANEMLKTIGLPKRLRKTL